MRCFGECFEEEEKNKSIKNENECTTSCFDWLHSIFSQPGQTDTLIKNTSNFRDDSSDLLGTSSSDEGTIGFSSNPDTDSFLLSSSSG